MRIQNWLLIGLLAVAPAACKHKDGGSTVGSGGGGSGSAAASDKKLFDRLGGMDAIKAVVDDFVGNVAADARINARFANTDIPHFKQMLTDQVCNATGGPCEYKGKDMKTAHTGMKITEAEFTALVEDLVKSLDKFKVPEKEKGELLGALGGMKPQIVGL